MATMSKQVDINKKYLLHMDTWNERWEVDKIQDHKFTISITIYTFSAVWALYASPSPPLVGLRDGGISLKTFYTFRAILSNHEDVFINTLAGKELYHKKPTQEPIKADIKITSSALFGINIIFK